ncbi:hypothetical protein K431DRAFT_317343 [Polychaeton citri CBS 116435]|uniref:SAC3/GANP/THP3 conserved domain-containing protein n=1 Tax=Polychaeton citri CBS 116435 TaxID=1314669 RepID=A0A9P4QER1_9PEZI|nr:hypothetical protein K431DRAFT_317343 [Polychaeton citri CBS 116435]
MAAAPAFHAVPVRHTLSQSQSQPLPQQQQQQQQPSAQKYEWGPEVRLYVQRAFESDNAVPGIGAKELAEKLRIVITEAAESNQIGKIDWSTHPLPQQIIIHERESQAQGTVFTNMNNWNVALPDSTSRKRKSTDGDDDTCPVTPPWQKKSKKTGSLEDRITGKPSKKEKKQKQAETFRANAAHSKLPDALERRRQRFEGQLGSPGLSSRDDSPAGPDGPVVGTCQKVEKSYFRLTSAPKPEDVRPLPVLEQALQAVRKKWKKEHSYVYACDQLKAIRQDLTVQHIKNAFTVKVYEVHARIALEMADMGEYHQCQTQLRALYKMGLEGNVEEFTAYRILYFIYTCNRTDMNDMLADLTTTDKARPAVRHALQCRAALSTGNYHKFFRLYDEADQMLIMGPYLLDLFVQRERLAALAAMCKAYKPDVSLRYIAKELSFHGNDDDGGEQDPDAGPRLCASFICEHGGEQLLSSKNGDVRLDTTRAGVLFETAKQAAFKSSAPKKRYT